MSSTLLALKTRNEARLAEEKKLVDRKRNILILALGHFIEQGYIETAEKLQQEAGISLSKFDVADNIDLMGIIQDYEDYYEIRFQKKPKLVRRLDAEESSSRAADIDAKKAAERERRARRQSYTSSHMPDCAKVENSVALKALKNGGGGGTTLPAKGPAQHLGKSEQSTNNQTSSEDRSAGSENGVDGISDGLVGKKVQVSQRKEKAPEGRSEEESPEDRLLKPIPSFNYDSEMRALAATISRDIFQTNPNVHWEDVVELDDAKRLLKEAVVMPIKYPQIFTGLLSPWCGILLYGPPGTGKTMLAKAVATECRTTFFNVSASSIVSKWRGDSEKLIRVLFELARYHSPSTIFLDEIDSIMTSRGGFDGGGEHEASRRMKTELLIQLDGLSKTKEHVFLLAASNLPWELDPAMLRRLEKRVLVPLPGSTAREQLLVKLLGERATSDVDWKVLGEMTKGFSGSDIKLVAKEAAMRPVRRLMQKLENLELNTETDESAELDPVSMEDIQEAFKRTKPSAHHLSGRYQEWANEFGSQ